MDKARVAALTPLATRRRARAASRTEIALAEVRRIDKSSLCALALQFEQQAAAHPEIKTRLVTRLAELLRAIANEQTTEEACACGHERDSHGHFGPKCQGVDPDTLVPCECKAFARQTALVRV